MSLGQEEVLRSQPLNKEILIGHELRKAVEIWSIQQLAVERHLVHAS